MTEFRMYPQSVVWEITFACNMRCIHCGTSAGKQRPDELTTDEALRLADELIGLGTEVIAISGGEPLMRKDWREISERFVKAGVKTCLISNGLAVTPEIVDDFKRIGFTRVGFSFDGTKDTHNYIRQRDDSYDKVIDAMRMMAAKDVPFCAESQISNINIGELDQMRQILIDAKCPVWRIQMTTSTGRMMENRNLILSLNNYERLVKKMIEFKQKNHEITIDVGENIGYYGCLGTELWEDVPYFGCFAGTRVAGIESNGNVKGCLSQQEQFVEGNIRDSSFTAIWNNPNSFAYNRRFTRDTAAGACHDCKYLPLCRGGCTTTSVSASGCRADNPYCTYRMEQERGVAAPEDNALVAQLLDRFKPVQVKG